MELNSTLNQNVNTLFSNLEGFTQKEGLMGKPVTHGDKTFIPVVSVTLGYGGGNSAAGKNQQNNYNMSQENASGAGSMGMGALGLGARINTDAIILIDNDKVSMLPVSTTGTNMSQLINQIPQMLMGKGQSGQQQNQQGQQGQQGQQNQQQ